MLSLIGTVSIVILCDMLYQYFWDFDSSLPLYLIPKEIGITILTITILAIGHLHFQVLTRIEGTELRKVYSQSSQMDINDISQFNPLTISTIYRLLN